jgi:leader peptidase (prepilin peptidase) / N-methyltransferase
MMPTTLIVWPLAVAPVIGSFLGVVVRRLPAGRSVIRGRSACPDCSHVLGPRELVPVASWLLAGGRCRHCGAPVSVFYPAMELGALALAVWAALTLPADELWASCVLGWGLLALAAIDARELLLPDALTLPLVALGLLAAYLDDAASLLPHLLGAAIGYVFFAAVALLYRRLRGREGLGLGDAKLLAVAGAWVSWEGLPSVVLLGAIASLATLLVLARRRGTIALDSRLPFGPGLCLGIWVIWLYGPLN